MNRKLPRRRSPRVLNEWFRELQKGMGEARVCCGDWSRIMSPGTMTRNGPAAVLLDPPTRSRAQFTPTTPAPFRAMFALGVGQTAGTRSFASLYAATRGGARSS